jgi:alkylation response protein AidB-like acyl-CoA dehydrogenase
MLRLLSSHGLTRLAAPSVGVRALSSAPLPITTLTEEEEMIRDTARRFAETEVAPLSREMDESMTMDPKIIKGLFDNGLMGVEIPQEYNGTGASFLSACLVVEELAKVDAAVAVMVDVQNTLVNNIVSFYGNDDIKARCFPRLATDTVASFALSEAGSGSDAFALKTRAEDKGDHYEINGSKMWITNAGEAGMFFVMANLDMSAGYRGITCFLVERDTPGLEVGKKEDKLGIRASSTCPLSFDGVKVPKENVVGEIGKGYKVAIEILNEGRIAIGAQMLGIAQGAYNVALPYIFQRKQFGQYIGDFQAMQHKFADIALDIETARLLVYNAARRKQAGEVFVKEAAMAKLHASRVAERSASACIELMGGVGFTKDLPAERFFRDSKIGAIYEGTSNIQLSTIAKLLSAEYK